MNVAEKEIFCKIMLAFQWIVWYPIQATKGGPLSCAG